jgi:hypothetical protein
VEMILGMPLTATSCDTSGARSAYSNLEFNVTGAINAVRLAAVASAAATGPGPRVSAGSSASLAMNVNSIPPDLSFNAYANVACDNGLGFPSCLNDFSRITPTGTPRPRQLTAYQRASANAFGNGTACGTSTLSRGSMSFQVAAPPPPVGVVPEPSTLLLVAAGLSGLLVGTRLRSGRQV